MVKQIRKPKEVTRIIKDIHSARDICNVLSKHDYCELKRNLKVRCKPSIVDLCNKLELDDYESSILMAFYSGMSRVEVRFKLHICENKYTKDLKQVLNKIADYLKRQE